MKKRILVIAVTVSMIALTTYLNAETVHSKCQVWNAKVDPGVGGKTAVDVAGLSDREIIIAIGCLLKNRGKHGNARISGATNDRVSQTFPPATIELASLYYVSYLFTRDYQHGDGVALWGSHGVINPPGAIDTAYNAYQAWFRKVETLGLPEARKQHLDPLEGTTIRWYGK